MWSHLIQKSLQKAGRFAPTPTGSLHVGNAYSALLSYLSAKARGDCLILRIDDLDVRSLPKGCLEEQLYDLEWLEIPFDEGLREGGERGPYRQSDRSYAYESALEYLNNKGLIYPCYCSRKEIAAVAPHAQDEGHVYPGTCRPTQALSLPLNHIRSQPKKGRLPALRFNTRIFNLTRTWCGVAPKEGGAAGAERLLYYKDFIFGDQYAHLDHHVGDFILQRRDGVYAYQLACAVDDYLHTCALVARGSDLITSTHRQRLILSALDLPESLTPQYAHAGLLVDQSGERLAKRRKSTQLKDLRERGVSPERVRAALSRALGGPDSSDLSVMVNSFKWSQVSEHPVKWSL